MNTIPLRCSECGGEPDPDGYSGHCDTCHRMICERRDCNKPAGRHTIYGFGYLASVCDECYQEASEKDKADAIRFRYTEG